MQDRRGFLWIGTDDGLNRYDGQYFTVFRNQPGNAASVSGNIITGMLEDKTGVMWITTADGGLTKYDYKLPAQQQFKQYKHIAGDSSTIPVNIINTLLQDGKGNLWLATSGFSVIRFNPTTEKFDIPVVNKRTVLAMCFDSSNNLYAGGQGGGLLKINIETLQSEYDKRYDNLYAKLPHASITALHCDKENNIWFGSWDNVLYKLNTVSKKEEIFSNSNVGFSFTNDEVRSFAKDKNGWLWMGGHYHGLTIYDAQQNKFFNYRYNAAQEGTVADDAINCIYIDSKGLVWIGTNKGMSVYNPSQQQFAQTFLPGADKDMTIYDFYKDSENKLWIATSTGMYVRDAAGKFIFKEVKYNGERLAVTKFFKDDDGSFYIGTNYSLFKYNAKDNTVSLLPNTDKDTVMKRIIDSRIVSIIKDTIDEHPVLMAAPYGHYIAYYDFTTQHWVSRKDTAKQIVKKFNLKDYLIRKIYKTSDGHIWLATARYGLGDWDKQPAPHVNHLCNNPASQTSISNDNVYDILEDAKRNVWLSTYGGGLNYYDRNTKQFTHISATNNLLEGIAADSRNNVWMISNGNLNKYDPQIKTYTNFLLPDLEKTGGVKGNIYKDADGIMYAAGSNYFIEFKPEDIKEMNTEPAVYFTGFKIFNNNFNELLQQQQISLRYFQNYFTIEFAAPEFSGGNTEYEYMLQGFDKDWINIGTRNFVNYSNLPGGDYTFKVRAANKKAGKENNIASLQVKIIPPFWKQWWFFVLCALFISAAIYAMYRYRINELLKRQAIRNKIAQDLHDSMGSTLSSISVYSQVAKIYQQQQKQESLQHTLEKIGETSGEMISEMSDIVWAINPKNDNLDTIIQRMESFAKPLLQAKNIAFSFNYDVANPGINLQMEKRKNFYLIFKEAVNNTLKYSQCKQFDVSIVQHNHTISLNIQDDGIGFDRNKIDVAASASLSGNGLKNMQMRAKEMKADFSISSAAGKGTAVQLSFTIP